MNNLLQMEQAVTDTVEGTYLEGQLSLFSIVIPEATENLVINPSPVLATTGYAAMAGILTSSTTRQRRGPNSIRYAPTAAVNDGAYFATITTVTGWNTFSLDFWGQPGVPYQIYFASTAPAKLGTETSFVGEGLWRRPFVKIYETAGTTRRLYFTKNNSTDTNYFYVDGLQVEAKDHPTTYADGSMAGFIPGQMAYSWTGVIYASTSTRIADTGSGGRVAPLSDYGFRLMAHSGLGMAPANNISFPYARIDGENYQTTRLTGRDFSLMGTISGTDLTNIESLKSNLIQAVHPNRTQTRQPMLLLYQDYNEATGRLAEDIYQIQCSYVDGLKGATTNKYQEKIGINFRASNVNFKIDGIFGISLGINSIVGASSLHVRKNGAWSNLGTIGLVYCIEADTINSVLWVGGLFATADGITVNGVTYWNGSTFVAIGGATKGVAGGSVYAIAVDAVGNAWLAGDFTTAGGAAAKGLARWNKATDTFTCFNLATTTFGQFNGIIIDNTGTVIVCGNFTGWNGDAAQKYATSYTSAGVWTALGTVPFSANEIPQSYPQILAKSATNVIYIGSSGTGGTAGHLRSWNGTAWVDLGATDADKLINTVYLKKDGTFIICGSFATIAGIPSYGLALFNGVAFSDFGTIGTSITSSYTAIEDIDGNIFASIAISSTNVMALVGGKWVVPDIAQSSVGGIVRKFALIGTTLYVGRTASATILTTSTNSIDSSNYIGEDFTFVITGPTTANQYCTLFYIGNKTEKSVAYSRLTVRTGETITVTITSSGIEYVSNVIGVISSEPKAIANLSNLKFRTGINDIAILISDEGLGSLTGVTCKMFWKRSKVSIG